MADTVDKETRSRIMSRVRSKDTVPEMTVRRLIFSLGYRYRLHDPRLPGKPDIVFASRRKVIFVHGCFWHQHEGCARARTPKSSTDFWLRKLTANKERDARAISLLRRAGWGVLVLWACDLDDESSVRQRIIRFLDRGSARRR